MQYYKLKYKDYQRATKLIDILRKLLKQRNLAMINHRLLELNDILMNASVDNKEEKL